MARLTLGEQTRLARLALDRTRRRAASRVMRSSLMRWRYGAPIADEILIVPQDLRSGDPCFVDEIEVGHFGLGGAAADLDGRSPFELVPPSKAWERELHGFGWLRHLRAAGHGPARELGIALVADWVDRARSKQGPGWEPAVTGRRLISWIGNAPFLLEGVSQSSYDRMADSLGDQLIHLSATWRDAPDGYPRLLALTALMLGDLCIAGHDRHLAEIEREFAVEIERQIFPDGGHMSRNPGITVELLLDFLPLRQCFAARGRTPPTALMAAIRRSIPFVRFMRLGDGALGRFNGMAAPMVDALATVVAYDDGAPLHAAFARQSRYARLEGGGTVVVMDAGAPPPLELAGDAHAGCLSFEMSAGADMLLVNAGAPGPADQDWRAASRATASHNTLVLGNRSSAKLVRHPLLERLLGSAPIRFPDTVRARVASEGEHLEVTAEHDGYLRPFGLVHHRRLKLMRSGAQLEGIDRIGPAKGRLRLAQDIPFAIHFHLHPDVESMPSGTASIAELRLKSGARWHFAARGAAMTIEESVHLADQGGPRRSLQIVLRGATFGESEIAWVLARDSG